MGPFCSAGAPGAHLRGGKWVYEVEILSTGGSIIQVGWGTSMFRPSEDNGDGVGDDEHSWSYDGNRCKAWHGKDHKYVSVCAHVYAVLCVNVCGAVRIHVYTCNLLCVRSFYVVPLSPFHPHTICATICAVLSTHTPPAPRPPPGTAQSGQRGTSSPVTWTSTKASCPFLSTVSRSVTRLRASV